MKKIELYGDPTTSATRWLRHYFRGTAPFADFVRHFQMKYRTRWGTVVSRRAVYARIRRDVDNGLIRIT
jgi:hypothetical protein